MTLPNIETAQGKLAQKNLPGKRPRMEFVALLLLCLVISIFVSARKTKELIEHHDLRKSDKDEHAHEIPVRKVGTQPLQHESIFSGTIKSCLPERQKHCRLFIPEHTTTQRVALVSPSGELAQAFHRLLEVVVGRAKRKNKVDIDLILTSHIPPYGYGKTQ
jgi:hypothetical protein